MADATRHLSRRFAALAEAARRSPSRSVAVLARFATAARCLAAFGLPLAGLAPTAAAQPAAIQSVRFTAFAVRPLADVAFVPRANAAPQKLQFHPTARSSRYEYHGPMPLRFIDPATRAVVAEVAIPAGLTDVLLLFTPVDPAAGAAKLRYQVAVLDDGAARHGAGSLAIVNLSGLVLGGTINDRAVTLRPGLNAALPVGRAARMRFTTTRNQRAYQSYAGTTTLATGERALLILFPPFYPGAFEVQARLLIDKPGAAAPVKR